MSSGYTRASFTLPFILGGGLSLYLARATQHSFDGFAYVAQAATGSPWDRAIHVGFLAPLWVVVRGAGAVGVDPHVAANLWAWMWSVVLLAVATDLGRSIATPPRGPLAALTPALLWMCSPTAWDAALFCEIYGPLAATALLAARAAHHGRRAGAAGWLALAALIHPGTIALLPAILVLVPPRASPVDPADGLDSTDIPRVHRGPWLLVLSPLLAVLAAATFLPEWWGGGRGLSSSPPFDRSPWQSVQFFVRWFHRDLGVLGLLPVAGLVLAWRRGGQSRRWTHAVVLASLGTAVGLDRYRDNPGQLPVLALVLPLAPLGWSILDPWVPRAARVAVALGLLGIGIAEGTTRHDAVVRRIEAGGPTPP